MKAISFLLAASLLTLGCGAPGSSPLKLFSTKALTGGGPTCNVNNSLNIYRGSLDIAGSTSYIAAVNYSYDFTQGTEYVASNGDVLDTGSSNTLYAKQMTLSYQSEPSLALDNAVEPMYSAIAPGSSGDSATFIVDLLSDQAAQTLMTSVVPGASVDILVTFDISGTTGGGTNIRSSPVTYPIRVFNSGFSGTCAGSTRSLNGPCGNPGGQDGIAAGCCSDPAFAGVGGCP
jgi:hypothetical protein